MLTSELPIYRDTFELVSLLMDYVAQFPKSHKHTIGQKMTNVSLELFEYLQLANRSADDRNARRRMLESFLRERLPAEEFRLVAPLVKQVVMHCPEKNCHRKSPPEMWNNIPANKSLFSVGDDYGLPIGNLTSQIFANFYLHEFDVWMSGKFAWYGRYVDDFYVLARDKNDILKAIPGMRRFLGEKAGVKLHPDKVYLQHYTKGCKFTGSVVKRERTYAGNTTVANMTDRIRELNEWVADGREPCLEETERFACCLNSYFGFLKHHKTYAVKRKLVNMIAGNWWKRFYVSGHFGKISIVKKYRAKHAVRRKAQDIRNGVYYKNS